MFVLFDLLICVVAPPPHIYRHNTQHAIKASSAGIWDVYTRTDNVCPALLSLSLYLRQFRVVSDVCPAGLLFVCPLYGPFRPRSRPFLV